MEMEESNKKKKQRPYSEYERQLVVQLVQSKIAVLENRKTDGVSQKRKAEAWEHIASQYNNSSLVTQRTDVKQLKKMWQNFKAKARDAKTLESQRKRTGGGPAPPEMGSLETEVLSIMPNIMPTINVPVDSDTRNDERDQDADDDSMHWRPKRTRLESGVIMDYDIPGLVPDEDNQCEEIIYVVDVAKDNETPNPPPTMQSKDARQQPMENLDKLSFEKLKTKLLIQEMENNKKRFESEEQKKEEIHILEKRKLELEIEILEIKKKQLIRE